jgi:hypothetical protein
MIGHNLTAMHWTLRQYRLLETPEESAFHLSDSDFFQFLSTHKGSLALHPTTATSPPPYVKAELAVSSPERTRHTDPARPFRLRGDQHLVIRPTGTGPAELRFSRIATRGKLVTYNVFGADGRAVASGLMSAEVPVVLQGADSAYYHLVVSAGSASFMVDVAGAAWAVDGRLSDQGLHLLGQATPIYFHVPKETRQFQLSLEASPPGETAVAMLHAPDGRSVAEFDCTQISVDRQTIDVREGQAGWWKVAITQASTGALDDVYVKLSSPLSGYFSFVSDQALGVR